MPEDRKFIKRSAAALEAVMAKPFVPTPGVPQEAREWKKKDRPPVEVEIKRNRKRPMKAGVADGKK